MGARGNVWGGAVASVVNVFVRASVCKFNLGQLVCISALVCLDGLACISKFGM